jgi:hypothetical protein
MIIKIVFFILTFGILIDIIIFVFYTLDRAEKTPFFSAGFKMENYGLLKTDK